MAVLPPALPEGDGVSLGAPLPIYCVPFFCLSPGVRFTILPSPEVEVPVWGHGSWGARSSVSMQRAQLHFLFSIACYHMLLWFQLTLMSSIG